MNAWKRMQNDDHPGILRGNLACEASNHRHRFELVAVDTACNGPGREPEITLHSSCTVICSGGFFSTSKPGDQQNCKSAGRLDTGIRENSCRLRPRSEFSRLQRPCHESCRSKPYIQRPGRVTFAFVPVFLASTAGTPVFFVFKSDSFSNGSRTSTRWSVFF